MERRNVNRRTFITGLALPLAGALFLAACGDDASGDRPDVDGTDAPPTTAPPTTSPPSSAPGIAHPTGADEVVLRYEFEGGFVPMDYDFRRIPRVLVTGDGHVYFEGAQIEIYPAPILPPVLVGQISEERLQQLLEAARDANLFREVTYDSPTNIADAPDTVVTIVVDGRTYVHRAYALGLDMSSEENADRKALAEFTALLDALVSEDIGATAFEPEQYAIRSVLADTIPPPQDVQPNEADWPAGAGVRLVDASDCATVAAAGVQALFAESTQITRFVEDGVQYVLTVRPVLPGDAGCANG